MPYPESCPECGGPFRNTGTHFTARRNEIGRHVLLALGCQNTSRRFWWDFTSGAVAAEGQPTPARRASLASLIPNGISSNGSHQPETNGHATVSILEPPETDTALESDSIVDALELQTATGSASQPAEGPQLESGAEDPVAELSGAKRAEDPVAGLTGAESSLKHAFVRQLQLDRLTLRQMRSWLMSDEARRAAEVAAGATEATYERLSLILFGVDLPQLSGKPATAPTNPGMTAEERLELQREKARIRARQRRAAAKTNRQPQI